MSNKNATATWSGFSHQGQVGLLIALREIRRLFDEGRENELDIHFLEYEQTEDCAIYRKEGNNAPEYLSVHQVKAYYSQGHLLNTYRSVFEGAIIYQKGEDGKYVKVNGNKVPTGDFEPGQWMVAPCINLLHTTMQIGNWNDDTVDGWSPDFIIRKFQYTDERDYCGTEEIDTYLKQELMGPIFCNNDNGRSEAAIERLSYELDKKIRIEHATKEGKAQYDISFSLSEIRGLAISKVHFNEQVIFGLRKSFYNKYEEVVKNHEISEDHRVVMDQLISLIYESSDESFVKFLKRLNLDVSPDNLNDHNYWFNANGLEDVFFTVLAIINGNIPQRIDDSVLYVDEIDKQNYLLSSINRGTDKEKEVAMNILKNINNLDVLWDNIIIINQYIENSLNMLNPAINKIDFEGRNLSDKFFEFTAKSGLVRMESAINILNNEGTD